MAIERIPSFDPKSVLARVGDGRSIGNYRKDQVVFSQGNPADAVFYIRKGKVKISVVAQQGKEQSSLFLEQVSFSTRPAWPAKRGDWRQSRRLPNR
jgi:CRP-like cAMP-binding protein